MNKFKLLLVVIPVVFLSACSDKNKASSDHAMIVLGKEDSLFSRSLNEQRKFWVYVPGGFDKPDPDRKYAVVYLLDGDAHFYSVAGLIHQLSSVNGNSKVPEMIVVAIPNTDRTRDLTPSNDPKREGAKTSGGAENFTSFMKELILYVERHYPATGYRTLIGHSFGGLFAINTLMHHRELFNNYLAIDPSLWWDNRKFLSETFAFLDTSRFDKRALYVAEANTAAPGMTHEQLVKDTTEDTRHMRYIEEFIEYAKSKPNNGLKFDAKYYPADGHSSVVLAAEHDGLREMFSWFGDDPFANYYIPDPSDKPADMITTVRRHYATIAENFGYPYPARESDILDMGYYFLRKDRPDMALELFNYNTENYPKSRRAFEALGDYYIAVKDTTKAVENLTASLAVEEDNGTREKLNGLQKK